MEEISPLFAIQAEKALKANNPQLALEICKRGVEFFPDYQIGYVLMAEAYEMLGANDERDKLLEQIHHQFPKAITTKVIDEKIKSDGSLLINNEKIDDSVVETQYIEENSEEPYEIENGPDTISDKEDVAIESVIDELANIDELIDEAQSVIEDIEETIEDLEDEIATEVGELDNQILVTDENNAEDEEIIQEYAELESEIADLQDFANNSENPEFVVDFSEELLDIQKEHIPFESEVTPSQIVDKQSINIEYVNILEGINFLPFKFNYDEILELSKNITIDNYLGSESTEKAIIESDTPTNNPEYLYNVESADFIDIEPVGETDDEQEDNGEKHFPDDFVPTETLAMIYEKQGKYMNAIDIYQKLMEIHPEKMEHYLNKIMLLETDGN